MIDAPLATLFLPFETGQLSWPEESALFLRARAGAPLIPHVTRLICEQSFKPQYDALKSAGARLLDTETSDNFPLVLVLPPRQRDESRALLARAITLAARGGRVIASAANDEGARSIEADLSKLGGGADSLSKNKCRVFWTQNLEESGELCREWLHLDAARPIAAGHFVSRPGLFAWDRIDPASQLLAENLPGSLRGRAADLGAGFGYLASELLRRDGITALDVYEAERRALDLCRINLSRSSNIAVDFHWHDVTIGLAKRYDVVVTNPPFHAHGSQNRPDVGRRFIAAAADSLYPGGHLWLVANRHLPYEAALAAHFRSVDTVAQRNGFKVVHAVKAAS